jgi:hypothetical protein
MRSGGLILSATLALPRRPKRSLNHSYGLLRDHCARFRRRMKTIEESHGIKMSIRIFEETFSETKAWHPHANFFWLIPVGMTEGLLKDFIGKMLDAWVYKPPVGAEGVLKSAQNHRLLHSQDQWKTVCGYVLKHRYYFPKTPQRLYGAPLEKLEPWDILDLALTGDVKWQNRWKEYEIVMKGTTRVKQFTNRNP